MPNFILTQIKGFKVSSKPLNTDYLRTVPRTSILVHELSALEECVCSMRKINNNIYDLLSVNPTHTALGRSFLNTMYMGETKKHSYNILHIQFTAIFIILVQALKTWEALFLSPQEKVKI